VSPHPELDGLDGLTRREFIDLYMAVGEFIDEARRHRAHADLAYWLTSRQVLAQYHDERWARGPRFTAGLASG